MATASATTDDVDAAVQTVLTALSIVYTAHSSPDQRQQADAFLIHFQTSAQAWTVCDRIVSSPQSSHEAVFFAAHTLHTKCRSVDLVEQVPASAWPSLRDSLLQQLERQSQGTTARLLAGAIAALAVQVQWTTVVSDLLSQQQQQRPSHVLYALLTALPEECASDRLCVKEADRFQLRDALVHNAPLVWQWMQSQPQAQNNWQLLFTWIRHVPLPPACLVPWVQPSVQTLITPTTDETTLEHVTDVLVELVRMYPSHRTANRVLVEAMLTETQTAWEPHLRTVLQQQQQKSLEDDDRAECFCRFLTELGESYVSLIVQQAPSDVGPVLMDWVLACSSRSNVMTLSFWYTFLTELERMEPYERRQSTVDRYATRIHALVRICGQHLMRYEDEDMDDEDTDVERHRGYVAETIDDCCRLLGGDQVLRTLGSLLQTQIQATTDWRDVEACCACLAAVGRYVPRDEGEVLPFVFGWLIQTWIVPAGVAVPVPWRRTVHLLIGKYAAWLTARAEYIQPILPYLGQGLRTAGCEASSAIAIKELCACSHASASFAQPALELYEQVTATAAGQQTPALQINEELDLLEGVCLAASASIRSSGGDGRDLLNRLVQPVGNRLAAHVADAQATTSRSVIPELDRFTAIVRHLKLPHQPPATHPVVELIQSAWSLLHQATQRFPQSQSLAEAVCRLHKHCIRTCGATAYAPLMKPLSQQLAQSFETTRQSAFLYCASICVTDFGPDPSYAERLLGLVNALCTHAFTFLRDANDFSNHPDVVEELFYLADRLLRHCPEVLCASPLLSALAQSALVGMQVDHKGANRGTLKFMTNLVALGTTTTAEGASMRTQVTTVLQAQGPALVANMVQAMCGHLPYYASHNSDHPFPTMLWKLYATCPDVLAQWLTRTLASSAAIPDHAKADFLHAFSAPLTQSGFLYAVEEFEQVCSRVRRFQRRTR